MRQATGGPPGPPDPGGEARGCPATLVAVPEPVAAPPGAAPGPSLPPGIGGPGGGPPLTSPPPTAIIGRAAIGPRSIAGPRRHYLRLCPRRCFSARRPGRGGGDRARRGSHRRDLPALRRRAANALHYRGL